MLDALKLKSCRVKAFWGIAALGFAALGCIGCKQNGTASRPEQSPRAVLERLIAARKHGQNQEFEKLVVAERCHDLVNTLMAVDEFLNANLLLRSYVREHFSADLSLAIDQSQWGSSLGLFSRYVELISERIEDGKAIVSFSVDDRVPLRHAKLVIVGGQWRYDPGTGFTPELPAAFLRMAEGLRQALDELKSERLSATAIFAQPELLIDEVRLRLLPGIKMLPRPDGDPTGDE